MRCRDVDAIPGKGIGSAGRDTSDHGPPKRCWYCRRSRDGQSLPPMPSIGGTPVGRRCAARRARPN